MRDLAAAAGFAGLFAAAFGAAYAAAVWGIPLLCLVIQQGGLIVRGML